MLQRSDAEGLKRRGASDRDAGLSYFENPHFHESADDLDQWFQRCTAWASGWLEQDGGRDQAVQLLINRRHL